jgi:aspartyl-tRNA(Asn)/glutamyl-tRNA(Gln) amidotransferase subunit A
MHSGVEPSHPSHLSDRSGASEALARAVAASGVLMPEAYAWHRNWIHERASLYDPLVGPRILHGETIAAHRYIAALARIEALAGLFGTKMETFDVLLTPTVPILPPHIQALSERGEYLRLNALTFSLTELANRVDLQGVSLSDRGQGQQPIGLMLTGRRGMDRRLLEIAAHVEAALV